jgi:L-aminopeptidase/D-esterase-like protein
MARAAQRPTSRPGGVSSVRTTSPIAVPDGFEVGHWTDRRNWTGCTVVLADEGCVAAGEVRGGGPGTRESDLLTPAAAVESVEAIVLSGGSAYGLAAADGVVGWLAEQGRGHRTPSGTLVPLVPAAVVFDLTLVDGVSRPGPVEGAAACAAASVEIERGSVGAGTGCTVGKILGPTSRMKGGLGAAVERVGDATLCAIAVVNAVGDILDDDGSVLAGPRADGEVCSTAELLRGGLLEPPQAAPATAFAREATTLVCLTTDARLTKTEAWLLARAGSAGVARAVDPSATVHDGDVTFALASGRVETNHFALSALAVHAVARAIRDAVRCAVGAPGCPAVTDLERGAQVVRGARTSLR